ncbi:DUF397 domain-containing protein [Actinomadura sp. KC345]|uniref:DUF397 domain-containing protein n=1 Tax=Actinomadura sp. KC345 TaxID=2530371 RepID=UPI0010431250|nr:DUF397 domain-containing protein [Actinomadura sp. KC345]TDC40747.1 DUF397 domain-containing protein [Actinomadura sp. KC345]
MSEPVVWRKSSRSGSGGDGGEECVEIAALAEERGIRDSKAPDAGHLTLSSESFTRLVTRVKRGELHQ